MKLRDNSRLVIQKPDCEHGVPEPPIALQPYNDFLAITSTSDSGGGEVLVNWLSIPALCKELRQMAKEHEDDDV